LRRFGLPTDLPIIIHVNRLSEEKRINVLLDAVSKLEVPAHIALAGSGPMAAELREQAERLHIMDRVSFLGFVPDEELLALRRSAAIFAIPSEADLQSISTLEAMACGLPVVAANAYALPELAHHEENGFVFQPGDSAELAHYLNMLLGDQELRMRMGQESLKIVAAHDRSKVLDEWEELYRRLAIEFKEAKERRQQMRQMRKYQSYPLYRVQPPQRLRIKRPDKHAASR
jgi:glycosyltransferase involved in cell wall biosynthesis